MHFRWASGKKPLSHFVKVIRNSKQQEKKKATIQQWLISEPDNVLYISLGNALNVFFIILCLPAIGDRNWDVIWLQSENKVILDILIARFFTY